MSAVQDGYDSSQIGLILGVGALPAVFGGLVAPVLLHRISQKKLFHITTMPWVFVALFCAGWSFIDTIALSGYMVISFMVELAGALLIPTMGSFLPQLVESKELERANSTQNFVLGICSAAGFSCGVVLHAAVERLCDVACARRLHVHVASGAKKPS